MLGGQQSNGFSAIKGHYRDCVNFLSAHVHKPLLAPSCISLGKQEHVVISFFNALCAHILHIPLKHDYTPSLNDVRGGIDAL
jgi:hypothetical protein